MLRYWALVAFIGVVLVTLVLVGIQIADKYRADDRAPRSSRNMLNSIIRFNDNVPAVRYRPHVKLGEHHSPGLGGIFEGFTFNVGLFRLINNHRIPWLDAICVPLLCLGSGWVVLPILIVLIALRSTLLPVVLIALLIETAAVLCLKEVFSQPRPYGMLSGVYLAEGMSWHAFPSGDTAMAFVLAWSLKHRAPRWWQVALITLAAFIGYGRIYFGAHFPLDVVAGALIGISAARLAIRLVERRKAATATAAVTSDVAPPLPEQVGTQVAAG